MNGLQAAAAALCVITGTVYDSQHHPVAQEKVHLLSADKKELTIVTNATGSYRFSVLAGTYTLRTEGESVEINATAGRSITADLASQLGFFDEPQYKSAGVADFTYRGGHGSDAVFRSTEAMAKALLDESPEIKDPLESQLYKQGTDLLDRHKVREAADIFLKGVHLFPLSVRMLLAVGSAYYAEGAYDEAGNCFYKATDVEPRNQEPYLFLGKVQARQITESDGYKMRMERFVNLHPGSALANYYYGKTLPDEQAVKALQTALSLDSKLAMAQVQLGAIAARKGNYTEAIRNYQSAIATDPNSDEAHYRLSEAYRLTGEPVKAEKERVVFERLSSVPSVMKVNK